MDGEGPATTDPLARAELSQLRTQVKALELRMMDHLIRPSWRWVIAIWLAALAFAVAVLGTILHKP